MYQQYYYYSGDIFSFLAYYMQIFIYHCDTRVTYMYILLELLELRQMYGCFETSTMLTLLFLVSGLAANAKIVHE